MAEYGFVESSTPFGKTILSMPEPASELVAETPNVAVWPVLTKISAPDTCAHGVDSLSEIAGAAGLVLSILIVANAVRTGSTLPTLSTEK